MSKLTELSLVNFDTRAHCRCDNAALNVLTLSSSGLSLDNSCHKCIEVLTELLCYCTSLEEVTCSKHIVDCCSSLLKACKSLLIVLKTYISVADSSCCTCCKDSVLTLVRLEVLDCRLPVAEMELANTCIEVN